MCEVIPSIGFPSFLPLDSLTISVLDCCALLMAFFYTFVRNLK
ncbi:hypothetical protein M127_1486 [Bacteroides fragilis str. S6L5]|nr:hypothetical protein M137_1957 [Bacteroides fragilis str. S36L12]EYE53922.1 hypothetical protein M127_1486 [Bacteroides fragilis str. S6L5]